MQRFEDLDDPRRQSGRFQYPLQELLLTALCAVAAGAEDWVDVSEWGEFKLEWLRRFLPFEVLSIDIDRAIWVNMDRVYAEARTLLSNGFRYWFDDAEIEELHRGNAAFHVQTIEYEMLLKGFEKPPEHAVTDCFMTTVEILDYLRSYSSLNLSEKRMGEALRKAGFERRSKRVNGNPVYGWVIEKITPNPFVSYGL